MHEGFTDICRQRAIEACRAHERLIETLELIVDDRIACRLYYGSKRNYDYAVLKWAAQKAGRIRDYYAQTITTDILTDADFREIYTAAMAIQQ